MTKYDFTLEDKSQKSKNKLKSNNVRLDCIEGFVEDDNKHGLYDEVSSSIQIPPGISVLKSFNLKFNFYFCLINLFY